MKLALLTCGIYPDLATAEQQLWIFLASAAKAGFDRQDIHLYGVGRDFHRTDWRTKKLIYQLDYLKEIPASYTHVLYSDGGDALIVKSRDEIIRRYEAMGSPAILSSAAPFIANDKHVFNEPGLYDGCFDESIERRWPHVGGYMAEREAIISAFENMLLLPRQTYDDCWNWMDAWREGWFRPTLDSDSRIFYVDAGRGDASTDSCILHMTGGYADHQNWKDYKMEPVARRMGIV